MKKNTKKLLVVAITVMVVSVIGYTLFSSSSVPSVISSGKFMRETKFTAFSVKYSYLNTSISGQFATIIGSLNGPKGVINNDIPFSTSIGVSIFENSTQIYGISIQLIDMNYNGSSIPVSHVSTTLTNNDTTILDRFSYSFGSPGNYSVLQHLNAEFIVNLYRVIWPYHYEIKSVKMSI
ncbi:MAG: hypothetical protein ACYCPR_06590 [Thermoplasmataceae archaeon]|jgi:hypothetical protein|nr:hypothetical protein [Candidatus Thermoplasmatota archaeon]